MGSQLNLIAVVLYCMVAALAVRADWVSKACTGRGQWPSWMTVALAFMLLAFWRLIDGEHTLHHIAVDGHIHSGFYAERRWIQGAVVVIGAVFGAALLRRELRRRDRKVGFQAGWITTLALLILTGLRAISWHTMDMILFASLGPVHFNHVLDIGLTIAVGWCALNSASRTRHHARRRA